ncbi:transmembrane protein 165-like isoform X2 [Varroa jacobsoni]|uniref:GDT1 family protein n=1 Tax=Varroa destructor TaxID=109461 RepID=A0A7M7J0H7_VARDE|nr:transmembrane protein 165-like isoform X2 [Varroa destructor]XP_022708580.1 transmembrane protein 165-like isoform X2 [Varroa jacobsoni]
MAFSKMAWIIVATLTVVAAFLAPTTAEQLPKSIQEFEKKMQQDKVVSAVETHDVAPAPFLSLGGETAVAAEYPGVPNFWHGFVSSLSVIVVSEIGDKTFFIAAIMSMRHRRVIVFAGAISALIIMTVLSALMGSLTQVIPREYTHYCSIVLFIFFGVKMLYEASRMSDDEGKEEFEEVEKTLNQKEMETSADVESGVASTMQDRLYAVLSRVFWQALTLTFVAEWGDRSQLATIILAARENVWAVNIGAILGHSFCTCLAVLAGSAVAKRVSVKTVAFVGGVVFLLFAASAYLIGLDSKEVTL